jgi:hypothetical protein
MDPLLLGVLGEISIVTFSLLTPPYLVAGLIRIPASGVSVRLTITEISALTSLEVRSLRMEPRQGPERLCDAHAVFGSNASGQHPDRSVLWLQAGRTHSKPPTEPRHLSQGRGKDARMQRPLLRRELRQRSKRSPADSWFS